ncbi:SDR family NAD(P)-dependent oxidoreductase [Sinorhizobium sp. NFACC03]|uniref:SDR family NAD(P)-dependent oxidoreductase n=1 Tax=Sinorhizobium sp. NFACC03 TaxID=1566295 RepID=UPI000884DEDB|nr:SDR family NAD(P)-dependent oxidoreductase [Sinorhizobium sp. NFACC03]SDA59787.1 short chain dehydrogenase [Sinorhizobium sp. NFACC03]
MDTNDLGFAGKVALVAGASKGIGAATARAFAQAGASVVLLPRSQAAVEAWGLWPKLNPPS